MSSPGHPAAASFTVELRLLAAIGRAAAKRPGSARRQEMATGGGPKISIRRPTACPFTPGQPGERSNSASWRRSAGRPRSVRDRRDGRRWRRAAGQKSAFGGRLPVPSRPDSQANRRTGDHGHRKPRVHSGRDLSRLEIEGYSLTSPSGRKTRAGQDYLPGPFIEAKHAGKRSDCSPEPMPSEFTQAHRCQTPLSATMSRREDARWKQHPASSNALAGCSPKQKQPAHPGGPLPSRLFTGSASGGKAAAIAYTLIDTARLNHVDPQAWLAQVLERLPD